MSQEMGELVKSTSDAQCEKKMGMAEAVRNRGKWQESD
jgi:hypothetical protein